jgi:hypothetical protein
MHPGCFASRAGEPWRMVMLRRTFLLSSAVALAFPAQSARKGTSAKLYKDPNCGCCGAYANYLRENGFDLTVEETADFAELGRAAGVPEDVEGCHVTFVGDYVVSGHVPMDIVQRLLDERPTISGVTLPGMPSGSPGMGGDKEEAFVIYSFVKGTPGSKVYMTL